MIFRNLKSYGVRKIESLSAVFSWVALKFKLFFIKHTYIIFKVEDPVVRETSQ
jgi:hypothetical protein